MKNPVVVANFRTRLDAEIAAAVLTRHDIPFVIQSPEGMLYGPLAPGTNLLVRAEHADLARQLLGAGESEEEESYP